jgi:hypothetical protein
VYAGVPAGNRAFPIAQRALTEAAQAAETTETAETAEGPEAR